MTINPGQVASFMRHLLTYAMGGISMLGALHFINPQDAGTIGTSLTGISNGLADTLAAAGPLVAMASGLYAAWKASHPQQVISVKKAIDDGKLPGVIVVGTPAAGATT